MDLVNSLQGRLLFAVPKKGRLNQSALELLQGADIQFHRENRLDIALVKNLPIALIFLPAADIPTFVGQGRVDLGITGVDQVREHEAAVRAEANQSNPSHGAGCDVIMELGFGGCRLQVQVPEKGPLTSGQDLIGLTIGTSFVNLTQEYFARLELGLSQDEDPPLGTRLKTKVVELSGSVEAACALGVADGIVDLVESGETMRAAGLKAIDTIVDSTAVLVKSKTPSDPDTVKLISSRIRGVITAQKFVLCLYNIERDRVASATKITPGKRAATVMPLEEDGWVAVSSMVEKKRLALVMDDLAEVGAQDIIILDIHNTR